MKVAKDQHALPGVCLTKKEGLCVSVCVCMSESESSVVYV